MNALSFRIMIFHICGRETDSTVQTDDGLEAICEACMSRTDSHQGPDDKLDGLRADILGLGVQLQMQHQAMRKDVDSLRTAIHDLQGEFARRLEKLHAEVDAIATDADSHSTLAVAGDDHLSWFGAVGAVIVGTLLVKYGPAIVGFVLSLLALGTAGTK